MTNDDNLLHYLSSISGDLPKQKAVCENALQGSLPIARKALWAYSHYRHRTEQTAPNQTQFVRRFLDAWRDSILHMVNGNSSGGFFLDIPKEIAGTLFVGWHFPEFPLMLEAEIPGGALVLIASEEAWMHRIRKQHDTYCFRNGTLSSSLPRAFHKRRPIFAMLDHCYESSRFLITPFLSYPARMPAGLLSMAAKFKYRIVVLSVRARTIKPIGTIESANCSAQELAEKLNSTIETEILRRPHRWLLWPSVDSRWIDVDYGT